MKRALERNQNAEPGRNEKKLLEIMGNEEKLKRN